jgi:hypothetical protein
VLTPVSVSEPELVPVPRSVTLRLSEMISGVATSPERKPRRARSYFVGPKAMRWKTPLHLYRGSERQSLPPPMTTLL